MLILVYLYIVFRIMSKGSQHLLLPSSRSFLALVARYKCYYLYLT
nr:MAG TPA: protein of unknown function (DUF3377) [Caudoviricetes sp.]